MRVSVTSCEDMCIIKPGILILYVSKEHHKKPESWHLPALPTGLAPEDSVYLDGIVNDEIEL